MKKLIAIIVIVLIVMSAFGNNGENNSKNADIAVQLTEMNISTTVDEARIEANYMSVSIESSDNQVTNITLENTTQDFRLFIYDETGTDIARLNNITTGITSIDNLTAGTYYYKLVAANGDIFAGEFEVIGGAL